MNHMTKKKRVLHIIDSFGAGGAETWLLATVKYLNEHPELNTHFDFLLSGGKSGIFDDEIRSYGSEIFYVKYSFKRIFSFRKAFRKILKLYQYDAIHDHQDFISGWHFLMGGNLLPRRRVSHVHNPYNFVHNYVVDPVRWFSFRLGRWLMMQYTDKITGTSNAVMDEYGYSKFPYKKKRVSPAYCGFDIHKFAYCRTAHEELCKELNWDSSSRVALFIGRIGLHDYDTALNQKNPEFAFNVAKHLVSDNDDWKFVFVGFKGKKGEELESESRATGLEEKIKFLGFRNDVSAIMSASDILVFPSLMEGLGMVAVEAQATGLPCILSQEVPAEAIVCSELTLVKSLNNGPEDWARTISAQPFNGIGNRSQYENKLVNSPFSIDHSVNYLIALYS